ncbi:MAG: LysM peptidoglycan-binding domain-containing protein [Phycisphaerales bacterium]
MTRETKLALVLGFAVTLAVTVLISDHFSRAREETFGEVGVDPQLLAAEASPHERVTFESDATAPAERETERWTIPDEPVRLVMGDPDGVPATVREDLKPRDVLSLSETELFQKPRGGEPPRTPRAESSTSKRSSAIRRHQVAKSETLTRIAEKYYGDGDAALVNALAAFNIKHEFLRDQNVIRVGATLLIPPIDSLRDGVDPDRDVSAPVRTPSKPEYVTYRVKKNDSAWSLAQRFLKNGSRYKEILELNKDVVINGDQLPADAEIRIPLN